MMTIITTAAVASIVFMGGVETFEMTTRKVRSTPTPRLRKHQHNMVRSFWASVNGREKGHHRHQRGDEMTIIIPPLSRNSVNVKNGCREVSADDYCDSDSSSGCSTIAFKQSRRRSILRMGAVLGLSTLSSTTTFRTSTSSNSYVFNVPVAAAAVTSTNAPTVNINVNPLAHTFVVGSKPKPTRENDATRFLTNARVVILFSSTGGGGAGGTADALADEVVKLSTKRKNEAGPGVTPGSVIQLPKTAIKTQNLVEQIVQECKKLSSPGDTLIVGPVPSQGIVPDGKLKADVASSLETFVGLSNGGGIVSVLLDGPTHGVVPSDSGYTISDLLWYSVP